MIEWLLPQITGADAKGRVAQFDVNRQNIMGILLENGGGMIYYHTGGD